MREIKFRAWDGTKLSEVLAWTSDGNVMLRDAGDMGARSVKRSACAMLQFTGLKDKAGNEIYEGDIVSGHNGDGSPNVWPVAWDTEYSDRTGFNVGADDDGDCEVIGNTYENPELLK